MPPPPPPSPPTSLLDETLNSASTSSCDNSSVESGRGTNASIAPLLLESSALTNHRRAMTDSRMEPTYLDRIAMELLETERAYVNDLHAVIKVGVAYEFKLIS
jgi:hypothetical protein